MKVCLVWTPLEVPADLSYWSLCPQVRPANIKNASDRPKAVRTWHVALCVF